MDQSGNSLNPAQASALEYAWGEYRVWAATARKQRAEIFSWRFRVLILTVVGAILGTLSHEMANLGFDGDSWFSLPAIIGFLSGISIALAAFFSKEILSPERERRWVRARSMAEALKAETYLFRTGVPPYDTPDAATHLVERVDELLKTVGDVQAVTLLTEQKRERLPKETLSVSEYIEERVNDQIDNFYRPRAREYERVVACGRTISIILGALAAVLGVLGTTEWTAGWVAVITTITASIAAYLYAGRYQYLIVSYQATAKQLEALKTRWIVSGRPEEDPAERSRFIQECEEAISVENNAWMAKWLEGKSNVTRNTESTTESKTDM